MICLKSAVRVSDEIEVLVTKVDVEASGWIGNGSSRGEAAYAAKHMTAKDLELRSDSRIWYESV